MQTKKKIVYEENAYIHTKKQHTYRRKNVTCKRNKSQHADEKKRACRRRKKKHTGEK